MKNGWTGGQYSLFRFIFGAYLVLHFVLLLPWGGELFSSQGVLPEGGVSPLLHLFPNVLSFCDSPAAVNALLLLGTAAGVAFTLGIMDRGAALIAWYVWACLFGRNPLISNPSLPFVGWMLLAHSLLSRAPFGAGDARGRTDPAGGWRFDPDLQLAAWIVLSVAYTYSGWTKLVSPSWLDGSAVQRILDNPLVRPGALGAFLRALPSPFLTAATWGTLACELLFAPLALSKKLRPWLWGTLLAMHLSLILLIDFADLSFGMVLIHLFTFDPDWVKAPAAEGPDLVFYDGTCGLCHGFVRLLLAEDTSGAGFRFAPLGGMTFQASIPTEKRKALPDSLVLLTAEGLLLTRSAAVSRALVRLGGIWLLFGRALALLPSGLADASYDGVAKIRTHLFRRPDGACPLLTPALRERFSN